MLDRVGDRFAEGGLEVREIVAADPVREGKLGHGLTDHARKTWFGRHPEVKDRFDWHQI